jgi:DNA repair exonuclease SbcCD ATPase subunit
MRDSDTTAGNMSAPADKLKIAELEKRNAEVEKDNANLKKNNAQLRRMKESLEKYNRELDKNVKKSSKREKKLKKENFELKKHAQKLIGQALKAYGQADKLRQEVQTLCTAFKRVVKLGRDGKHKEVDGVLQEVEEREAELKTRGATRRKSLMVLSRSARSRAWRRS